MKVQSILIKGFRCFDATGQSIEIDNLTCLIGPNASGKTATMAALGRMFAESQTERTIRDADFHLAAGEQLKSMKERHLSIEVKLVFPELDREGHLLAAIPESFNQMVVDEPNQTPYCRIRLESDWTSDGTASGEIHQQLWWILTSSNEAATEEGNRRRVTPAERARLRVIYVPAARDPSAQIRSTTTTAFGRLLRVLDWGGKDVSIQTQLVKLKAEMSRLTGIATMNAKVQAAWSTVYDGVVAARVAFQGIDDDPSSLLELLVPTFAPSEQGSEMRSAQLSDGLRSLFSLSLPIALYRVEELLKTQATASGFVSSVADRIPMLTIFAVEEPENHLSPHYVGKVMGELSEVSRADTAQVILSSHSPSIMGRIEPDQVRYFLGGEARPVTEIRALALPSDDSDEAFKYVREAVRGYPELYFSRLVVLGEGPSEEIVLRRVFQASGTPLDAHFISVVPLGGRHVNHFWRLLGGLGIPFITLLDLDREKQGGGWGRIQYVRDQLVALFGVGSPRLEFRQGDLASGFMTDVEFETLNNRSDRKDKASMDQWVDFFRERFDVFFSVPLDLDFAMLEAFPDAYKRQAPPGGGPRLPTMEPDLSEAMSERMRQVLAADAATSPADVGESYGTNQIELFPWYKYLFVDGSKPVAHMRALVALDAQGWVSSVPEALAGLVGRARHLVAPFVAQGNDGAVGE